MSNGQNGKLVRPVHLTTPVTALAFHNSRILISGQGPFLKAQLVSTTDVLCCENLGGDLKIHRIVLANTQQISDQEEARLLLVYGSKTMHILRLWVSSDPTTLSTRVSFEILWSMDHLKDWILDAQWLWPKSAFADCESPTTRSNLNQPRTCAPTSIAVAYAHNFVDILEFPVEIFGIPDSRGSDKRMDLAPLRVSYSRQSVEHCTLFCGQFHNNTLEDLVFASGTVFCHALLWKVYNEEENIQQPTEAPVLKTLIGHEGILFGIRWSDDGNSVCTVSDDRTIRIWTASPTDESEEITIFGHAARVWDCQMIGNYLISVSEDSTCRVWNNPITNPPKKPTDDASQPLACWEGHEGKSTWSLAVSENGIVATGGGDGGIHLWRLDTLSPTGSKENEDERDSETHALPLPPWEEYGAAGENPPKKESVRDFVIISHEDSIHATNSGHLLKYNITDKIWTLIVGNPTLVGYSTLETSRCGRIVVAGCLNGSVVFASTRQEFEPIVLLDHCNSKIQTVFVYAAKVADAFMVVAYCANNTTVVYELNLDTENRSAGARPTHMLSIPPNNKTIHCAFYSPEYDLLLLGSREGAMTVFELAVATTGDNGQHSDVIKVDCSLQLLGCHGKDSVTSILLETETGEGRAGLNRVIVYTSGRDGSWAKYKLLGLQNAEKVGMGSRFNTKGNDDDDDDSDIEEKTDLQSSSASSQSQQQATVGFTGHGSDIALEKIFHSRITKGWLEQILIIDDELLLLGFWDKKLFVYNETKHFEVFSMHCAGSNRRWRFRTEDARLERITFMFHKNQQIQAYVRELSLGSLLFQNAKLQNNFHGREVRALQFLQNAEALVPGSPAPIVFASGGEDCRLRIFQYIPYNTESSTTSLLPLLNIKPHIQAIRCLSWSGSSDSHTHLLFTGGAAETLKIWEVTLRCVKSTVAAEVVDRDGSLVQVHPPVSLGCLELCEGPRIGNLQETRIMDMNVFRLASAPRKHFIATVYSDAAIRLWVFDEEQKGLSLIINSTYHGKCILQVAHVLVQGERVVLLTAATDGKVAIWEVTLQIRKHLESVQSKDFVQGSSSRVPDKALVQRLQKGSQMLGEPLHVTTIHMSGINSLAVHGQRPDDGSLILATAGDDNALVATRINLEHLDKDHESSITVTSVCTIARSEDAHFSAIQSVAFTSTGKEIVTTSQDQTVRIWNMTTESGLTVKDQQFVHVPDPSTMDILPGVPTRIAIAGIGVQIFELEDA